MARVSVTEIIPSIKREGLEWTPWGKENKLYWDKATSLDKAAGRNLSTPLLRQCFYKPRDIAMFSSFANQIVVDLGAGASIPQAIQLVKACGARAYVGVDLEGMHGVHLDERVPSTVKIPFAFVEEDMLSFLRRVPDKSISAICSHVDWAIVTPEYATKTTKELERTLHPQGGYLRSRNAVITPSTHTEKQDSGIYTIYSQQRPLQS